MRLTLLVHSLFIVSPAFGQPKTGDPIKLTLDRIFASDEFRGERVAAVKWLEGDVYTSLQPSKTQKGASDIVRTDATGKSAVLVAAEKLIPPNAKTPLAIHDYEFSKDLDVVLIYTNSMKVWRQNTRGDYWLFQRSTGKLTKLGGNAKPSTLMFAKLSPDGSRVGYVRDNNLHVESVDGSQAIALTKDGTNEVINGTFDWVYEEEFFCRDGWRWSPDGKHIAYWQLDTRGVKTFTLIDDTSGTYPTLKTFAYPKTGERNSLCRIGVVASTGGETKWMDIPGDTRTDFYLPRMEWSDNPKELVIQRINRLQNAVDVLIAESATGTVRTVLTERDGARVVHVDEKGGYVYFLASPEIHTQQYLYRVSLREGGAPERLTPHDQPGWHDYQFSVSCVWIRAENESAGAGFVIDVVKKQVVTCRHLVADRTKVDVIFPWVRDGEVVADRQAYLQNRAELRELGLLVTGKVVKTSDESDLALLELESLPAGTHAVALAPTAPAAGDRLRVIGNRLDLDTLWNVTTGPARVRGRLAEGYFWRGKKLAVNATVVIGQLPTEEGDSGGPVFNDRGEVVGVATALRRQCPLAAVVVAASEIRAFAGLPAPAPPKEAAPSREAKLAETLMRSTVWVRPTATDLHRAGVLLDTHIVLTCGNGLTRGDRLGVAFPVREKNQWVAERAVYKDPVALALRGSWREGVVLAVDRDRELALIKLESTPPNCQAVPLSQRASSPGDRLHVMSHPSGLEFAWVYAAGAVRQHGRIAIAPGDTARKVQTLLCQLPAQAGSPGGPILNDAGELVGVLAARESTQQVGYAVAAREIAAFMEVARDDRPPRTVAGVWARIEAWPECVLAAAAVGLARQGESHRTAGRINEAKRACDQALSLDSHCVPARLCRARMLESVSALAELDHAVESGRFDREVLLLRADLASRAKDWRKARGDLERLVDVNPLDAAARQRLVGVLLELNEDAKALAAVRDTLRADAKRLPDLARDLLSQADALAKKFPDAPAIPAAWLLQALTAVENAIDEPGLSRRLARTLQEVAATKDDAARLALLQKALHGLTAK